MKVLGPARGTKEPHRSITNSARNEFANCRRMYFYEYEMFLAPKSLRMPLFIGSAFHEEMERFYRKVETYSDMDLAVAHNRISELVEQTRMDPFSFTGTEHANNELTRAEAIICGMLGGYVKNYQEDDAKRYEVVDAEHQFAIPLKQTMWKVMGKLDLIIRRKEDGKYGVMEHKTAATINMGYVSRIAMDRQTLRYVWAAQQIYGRRFDFVLYNVIKKPQQRQGKKESFPEYTRRLEAIYEDSSDMFYRENIPIDQNLIKTIPEQDEEIVAEIERCRSMGKWYQNFAHCYAYNSTCPFMRLCVEGLTPDTLGDFRTKDCPHEELK